MSGKALMLRKTDGTRTGGPRRSRCILSGRRRGSGVRFRRHTRLVGHGVAQRRTADPVGADGNGVDRAQQQPQHAAGVGGAREEDEVAKVGRRGVCAAEPHTAQSDDDVRESRFPAPHPAKRQKTDADTTTRFQYNCVRHRQWWVGKMVNIDADTIVYLKRVGSYAIHYNANVTNQFIRDIPEMLWWQKILQPFLNLEDLSILRCTNTFFQSYWESVVLIQNVIRVPQGCPTVEKAMALAVVFSGKKEYTKADPLKIQVDVGVHEVVVGGYGMVDVTCSHITFVGNGNDQTTIRGGFRVNNQQNVKFEELTITNRNGYGLRLRGSETNVDVLKCVVKECGWTGMAVGGGATVTATQCEFMENGGNGVLCDDANTKARLNECQMHHNGFDGLWALNGAVVDLHGTKTDIHSNKADGIWASSRGKVNIHLPSQHNTSHDNVRGDRIQNTGGSIANINADGTFTHT